MASHRKMSNCGGRSRIVQLLEDVVTELDVVEDFDVVVEDFDVVVEDFDVVVEDFDVVTTRFAGGAGVV